MDPRPNAQNEPPPSRGQASPGPRKAGDLPSAAAPRGDLAASEVLFDLYDRMLGGVEVPAVLREVVQVACQSIQAERASVYLLNRETDELESVAVIGNVARTIRVPIDATSLAGYCALTGKAFVVGDAYGDLGGIDPALRFDRRWDRLNAFRTRDVMCAPATFKGRVMGVVQAMNSLRAPFTEAGLPLLRTLCRLIGYALYHAKLYDDLATLGQLEKQKAEFMRIMVHELKSPVAAARMMNSAMLTVVPDNPRIVQMTSRVNDRLDQLLATISDILDLANVKSGEPLGDIAVLDLAKETDEVCQAYREPAAQKGLRLEIALPSSPVPVRLDRKGYHLVMSNLLSNAVKYTPSGFVRVELAAEGAWAVLRVADSGIGIPPQDVPKLFREFFRASNAKRMGILGSGVGLAGVKRIIERFGGHLELQSRENAGTTFLVRLPLAAQAPDGPAGATPG